MSKVASQISKQAVGLNPLRGIRGTACFTAGGDEQAALSFMILRTKAAAIHTTEAYTDYQIALPQFASGFAHTLQPRSFQSFWFVYQQ